MNTRSHYRGYRPTPRRLPPKVWQSSLWAYLITTATSHSLMKEEKNSLAWWVLKSYGVVKHAEALVTVEATEAKPPGQGTSISNKKEGHSPPDRSVSRPLKTE